MYKEVVENQLNVKQLRNKSLRVVTPRRKSTKRNKAPKRKSVSRDVRIALNTIKQSLSLVSKSGIDVETEEEDSEEFYTITVKIPKKK